MTSQQENPAADEPTGEEKNETPDKELSLQDILGADDLIEELIDTPEWGGKTRIRQLTVGDRTMLGEYIDKHPNVSQSMLVAGRAIINKATGKRLEIDEIKLLSTRSGDVISRIAARINAMSWLGQEAREEAKKD